MSPIEGLLSRQSSHGVKDTMDRLEAEVRRRGITVFARVDHAAGAASAGLELRPTEVLIFGNPKGGTPLMQSVQQIGLELPLKMLGWEDASGATWLSWNDLGTIATRYGAGPDTRPVVEALGNLLVALAESAAT